MAKKFRKHKFKNMKKYTPAEYVEWMRQILEQEIPICNNDGERLIIQDNEEFRQAYDPNDPPRSVLPPWWFVSHLGNVIDLSYPEDPEWRNKYWKPESRSYFYRFPIVVGEGIIQYRNMELHNLVGLVFGSERFGDAEKKLQEKGLNAMGRLDHEKPAVNGHHMDGNKKNNDSSNIQFLSTPVHELFSQIPKLGADVKRETKFMQRFSKLMDKEVPGESVVLTDGTIKTVATLDKDSQFVKDIEELLRKTIFVFSPAGQEKGKE